MMVVICVVGGIIFLTWIERRMERSIQESRRRDMQFLEEMDRDYEQYLWEVYEDPERDTNHEPISFHAWWEEKQRPRLALTETTKVTPYR